MNRQLRMLIVVYSVFLGSCDMTQLTIESYLCGWSFFSCDVEIYKASPKAQTWFRGLEDTIQVTTGHLGASMGHLYVVKGKFPDFIDAPNDDAFTAGVCIMEIRTVVITELYLEHANISELTALVAHEIMHCLYGLDHIKNTIMGPVVEKGTYRLERLGLEQSLKELIPHINKMKKKDWDL